MKIAVIREDAAGHEVQRRELEIPDGADGAIVSEEIENVLKPWPKVVGMGIRVVSLEPLTSTKKGACICPISPEHRRAQVAQDPNAVIRNPNGYGLVLDHRCVKHGEKAEPAVWGRHKEMQLGVSLHEWEALSAG